MVVVNAGATIPSAERGFVVLVMRPTSVELVAVTINSSCKFGWKPLSLEMKCAEGKRSMPNGGKTSGNFSKVNIDCFGSLVMI